MFADARSSAGLGGGGEDLAFTVTRKRFGIRLFDLPPAEEEDAGGGGGGDEGKQTKVDIEF